MKTKTRYLDENLKVCLFDYEGHRIKLTGNNVNVDFNFIVEMDTKGRYYVTRLYFGSPLGPHDNKEPELQRWGKCKTLRDAKRLCKLLNSAFSAGCAHGSECQERFLMTYLPEDMLSNVRKTLSTNICAGNRVGPFDQWRRN